MDTHTDITNADTNQPDDWTPTDDEIAALDRLIVAISSAWGGAWETGATEDGDRHISLSLFVPGWPMDVLDEFPIATLSQQPDCWEACDRGFDPLDEPAVEAGSLSELAEMLGEWWAPQRWALATAADRVP